MVNEVTGIEELLDANEPPNVRLGAARTVAQISIHQHGHESMMPPEELEEAEE